MAMQRRHWQGAILLATFVVAGVLGHAVYVLTKPPPAPSHVAILRTGQGAFASANEDVIDDVKVSATEQRAILSLRIIPGDSLALRDVVDIVPQRPEAARLNISATPTSSHALAAAILVLRDATGAEVARFDLGSGGESKEVALLPTSALYASLDARLDEGPSSGLPFRVELRIAPA